MKFSAALVAAYMAATATALPVKETEAVQKQYWGNPIVDHTPVPNTRRRVPAMHIIEKIPVPERRQKQDDVDVSDVVHTATSDSTAKDENKMPDEDDAGAVATGNKFAESAFWSMPFVDHVPYPGKRHADEQPSTTEPVEEQMNGGADGNSQFEKRKDFPVVTHRPYP